MNIEIILHDRLSVLALDKMLALNESHRAVQMTVKDINRTSLRFSI